MYRMTCLSRSSSRGECKLFPNFGNISPENRLELRLYCENHLENRFSVLVILKNANSFSSLNTMSWKWCNGKWDTSRNVQYEEFERTKLFIIFDLFQKRGLWVKRQNISNTFNAEFVRNAETRSTSKFHEWVKMHDPVTIASLFTTPSTDASPRRGLSKKGWTLQNPVYLDAPFLRRGI